VGNNIPVFFIQDAVKFPDLIHAAKPEPNNEMPQAATAHNTFWDFISLTPESMHMIMWAMSDRTLPRSLRTMEGFGVHTFRLVNANGESTLCKFHWKPAQGTHSQVWDEAVKVGGADPDFHRRDLWAAIESGDYPEWELGLQVFSEEQAEQWSFDVLDATKLVPEELVPVRIVGKMVLNRNTDNFFAETEQVAFCPSHLVPGIDFTNDPLLQGRIFSYTDTQLTRLGGPNFHEIPINASLTSVHNGHRDGFHRRAIDRGAVAYNPNSIGGGCPFQSGLGKGLSTFPRPVQGQAVRGSPEKFAEHYAQAILFYNSQLAFEQRHIADALRFELSKVTLPAIRERVLACLRNISEQLASTVAAGLGMQLPAAMKLIVPIPTVEVKLSPALSLMARPGRTGLRSLRVALYIANGVLTEPVKAVERALLREGAVPRFIGPHIGKFRTADGGELEADAALDTEPGFLFDAIVLPDGAAAVTELSNEVKMLEAIRDQHFHCKPILVLGASQALMTQAGVSMLLPNGQADPGIVHSEKDAKYMDTFSAALLKRRHFEREPARKF
jgi:catalase